MAADAVVRRICEMVAAGEAVSPPSPEWVTAGVADALSDAFSEALDHSRIQARALAECELAVASRLDASYPADVRASALTLAWMNLATADLNDAAPRAALKCVEQAEEALRGHPNPGPDRATVDVARATVLHTLGRDHEARQYAERARAVYEEFGNRDGSAECREILAMLDGRP